MAGILCVFLFLALFNNWGFVHYLWESPSAFSGRSLSWMVAQDLAPVAVAVLFFLILRGLGFRILRIILGNEGADESAARVKPMAGFAYALGLGLMASAVFLFGLLGLLSSITLSALCFLGILLAWPHFPRLNTRRWRFRISPIPSLPLWKAAFATCLLYSTWHILVTALAPPTEWDVLAYHLAIPKLYWVHGRIQEIPWLVHSHWPHLMETLYVFGLWLGRDNLAALIHATAAWVLAWSAFCVAKKYWGDVSAWCAAALVAAQPVVLRFSGTAHSDGGLALFYFLASLAVWNWCCSGSRRWLILGGILAGLSACAKLHGIILTTLLAAQIAYAARALGKSWSKALGSSALFFMCGFCVVLPWYLKTWAWTGNPIWPFFPRLIGDRWGASAVTGAPPSASHWAWLFTRELLFHDGPQFLLLPALTLPALAIYQRRSSFPSLLRFLWMPIVPYLVVVSLRDSAWRYSWPFYPALALAAGWAVSEVWAAKSHIAKAMAFGILAFGLWPVVRATENNPLFEVTGLQSRLEPQGDPRSLYLERSLGIYRFCQMVNRDCPRSKVLLFREIRGYYLDVDYMWGDPTNQGLIRYSEIRDSRQLGQELSRLGITHVWINEGLGMYRTSPDYYTPRTMDLMGGLLRSNGRPVIREGTNTLYELSRI